jgi:F420-non-reducing hydrogenase large subunit
VNDAGQVTAGRLKVLEMRGFEKLVDRMELFKMPLITSRICGVCPVAHHVAAVAAIEQGLGVEIPPEAKLLRDLLYFGSIIHSHALSVFVLSGPDLLLGIGAAPQERNVFHLLKVDPELAKKVLRLRTMGQRIVEITGGRGIHPVTAVPGGMASRPSKEELANIADWAKQSVAMIEELGAAVQSRLQALAEFHQAITVDLPALALSDRGALTFLGGDCTVVDNAGSFQKSFAPADYAEHMIEHVMPDSFMKSVRLRGAEEQSYFVGPLARVFVNGLLSTPKAQAMLTAFRAAVPRRVAALDFISARIIEMMFAAERMAAIVQGELTGGPISVECAPAEGRFVAAVEAPRGLLIHDYTAGKDGRIVKANLIVATQNNYDAINHVLKSAGELFLPRNDDNLLFNCLEFALRCFDPCLSCATHMAGRMPMEVMIRKNGALDRTITRGAGV